MNKQVFNKITNKFEYMHITTANELEKKNKVQILKDSDTLECLILKHCHIDNKRLNANDIVTLSVVDAHKYEVHGYLKIQPKKKELNNKLEKTQPEIKEDLSDIENENKETKKPIVKRKTKKK